MMLCSLVDMCQILRGLLPHLMEVGMCVPNYTALHLGKLTLQT